MLIMIALKKTVVRNQEALLNECSPKARKSRGVKEQILKQNVANIESIQERSWNLPV